MEPKTASLPPWKLRAADFSKPGWHVRPTVGFELFFEFLRLSPSYELARKDAQEGLTPSELASLPSDFAEVRQTYELLGDVQQVLFRGWWIDRGLAAFGSPVSRPRVHELAFLPGAQEAGAEAATASVQSYLEDVRRDEGLPAAMLLAVPLDLRKSEVIARVSALFDARKAQSKVPEPKLKLQGERLRAKVLFKGVRLLWMRSAFAVRYPNWPLWRLGTQLNINPETAKALDIGAKRSTEKDPIQITDRVRMTKSVSRDLAKYERIAENAARGRFPSEAPVNGFPFDYRQLASRIRRKNTWERRERDRLLELRDKRAAARAQLRLPL